MSYEQASSVLNISAHSEHLIKNAALGVRSAFCERVEKKNKLRSTLLVDPIKAPAGLPKVELVRIKELETPVKPVVLESDEFGRLARLQYDSRHRLDDADVADLARIAGTTLIAFRLAFSDGLRKMRYRTGHRVQVRVFLGELVFSRCPQAMANGLSLPLGDFIESTRGPNPPVHLRNM